MQVPENCQEIGLSSDVWQRSTCCIGEEAITSNQPAGLYINKQLVVKMFQHNSYKNLMKNKTPRDEICRKF